MSEYDAAPVTNLVPIKSAPQRVKRELYKGDSPPGTYVCVSTFLGGFVGVIGAASSALTGIVNLSTSPDFGPATFGASDMHFLVGSLALIGASAGSYYTSYLHNRKHYKRLHSETAIQLMARIPKLQAASEKAGLPKETTQSLVDRVCEVVINVDASAVELEQTRKELASTADSQDPAAQAYSLALTKSSASTTEFVQSQVALVDKLFSQLNSLYWARSAAALEGINLPEPAKALTDLSGLVDDIEALRHTTEAYVQLTSPQLSEAKLLSE